MDINLGKIEIEDYTKNKYEYVGPFYEELALVRNQNSLYGYINKKGVEVIPCQYEEANHFSEGLGLVCKNHQYMFLDCTGTIKLELSHYKKVRSFHEERAVVARNGKYGYIDKKGVEVISCQFVQADDFSEGLAIVKNHQYANNNVIDTSGVVQKQFLSDYANLKDNEKKYLQGLKRKFDGGYCIVGSFHNGIAPIRCYGFYAMICGRYEAFDAYVDKDGEVYYNKREIEELDRYYKTVSKPLFLGKKNLNLVYYCSKITFLGKTVTIKADTKEELEQKKKELLSDIKTSLQTFQTEELEKIEKTKEKVKK